MTGTGEPAWTDDDEAGDLDYLDNVSWTRLGMVCKKPRAICGTHSSGCLVPGVP